MADQLTGLRHAECSRAPDYITNGHGYPKQTTSCTWPYVVSIGEDPAARGHWCAFTDLYHAMPCHACLQSLVQFNEEMKGEHK